MVQECLPDDPGIQIFQGPGIPVEFLPGSDTLRRNIDPLALVVFPDPLMGLIVVIVLDKQLPPMACFFKSLYLLDPAFVDIAVDQAVIDLYLLSEYSDKRYYPQFFIIRTFPENAVVMRVIL